MKTLEELKPGDKVIWSKGHWSSPTVESVERVTATQICVKGAKYAKRNGYKIGQRGWGLESISPATEDEVIEIRNAERTKELLSKISDHLKSQSLDTLEILNVHMIYPDKA